MIKDRSRRKVKTNMRLSSQKKKPVKPGRVPSRIRGKKRVADLIEAAVGVFAEKGFETATMTEIAARAGAPIGSLYQFFPSKEALADALIARYSARLAETLDATEQSVMRDNSDDLAAHLVGLLLAFREERAAVLALLEARQDWSTKPPELRSYMRDRIAGFLKSRNPGLTPRRAVAGAIAITQIMKAAVVLNAEGGVAAAGSTLEELRRMTALYLRDLLGGKEK